MSQHVQYSPSDYTKHTDNAFSEDLKKNTGKEVCGGQRGLKYLNLYLETGHPHSCYHVFCGYGDLNNTNLLPFAPGFDDDGVY